MIALLDNTVLSNFASVERPDLVQLALGEMAATVEEAFAELQAGIQLQLLPQPVDVYVQRARISYPILSPHPIQQFVAGDSLAGVLHQPAQQASP